MYCNYLYQEVHFSQQYLNKQKKLQEKLNDFVPDYKILKEPGIEAKFSTDERLFNKAVVRKTFVSKDSPPLYEHPPNYSFFHLPSLMDFDTPSVSYGNPPQHFFNEEHHLMGSKYFNSPEVATAILKVGTKKFYVHAALVTPHSGYLRDILNFDYQPKQVAINIKTNWRSYFHFVEEPRCMLKRKRTSDSEEPSELKLIKKNLTSSNIENRITLKTKEDFFLEDYYPGGSADEKKVILLKVPHQQYFSILLKWCYSKNKKELFEEFDCLGNYDRESIYKIIELANFLQLAEEFYDHVRDYFLDNVNYTLSRSFHCKIISEYLFSSYLTCSSWSDSDKLAFILWWSRSLEDDKKLTRKDAYCENKHTDNTKFLDDVQGCTCERNKNVCNQPSVSSVKNIVNLYVNFNNLDEEYCAELNLLLPITFQKIML
ncbi:hypothetical protein HK099_004146 [Clydaea vesicula]|uniref:BTB domain-containing protein n=1 Tax=Clydaea vesicula TaxID=447962 RepID=A0AAD5XVS5_9FUNG|nr:hypothetical protein HK099_004146 [Clydaea vesicula]